MTANIFKDWFLNRFINHLEEDSIITIDNANYHLVTLNKVPNNSAKGTRYRLVGTERNSFFF
jgi:hypothetical protein